MQKTNYWAWWWEMFKRWWWYWGIVGVIQVAFWFVPQQIASQFVNWVRWGSATILIIPLLFWIPYKVWCQAKPEIVSQQEKNPNNFISIHLCGIDFEPLEIALHQMGQDKFVYLKVCFCNALFHDIKLTSLRGTDEIGRLLLEQSSLEIKQGFTSFERWPLSAAKELEMNLGDPLRRNPKLVINLIGYDDRNREYTWKLKVGD